MRDVNVCDEYEKVQDESECSVPEKNGANAALAAIASFEEKTSKECLFALVDTADKYFGCGYTFAEKMQMVKNMYKCCSNQVDHDLHGCEQNRRAPIHRNVTEAVSSLYTLGFEKMKAFKPEKGRFSTFMNTVYVNWCNTEYGKRYNDIRYYAKSTSDPISGSDDSQTYGDIIGASDHEYERKDVFAAIRAAYAYVVKFASEHLSDDEFKIFCLRRMDEMSNKEIVEMLSRDRKSVENSYYRATDCLRKDSVQDLNAMLQHDYGYHDVNDVLYNASILRDTYYDEAA